MLRYVGQIYAQVLSKTYFAWIDFYRMMPVPLVTIRPMSLVGTIEHLAGVIGPRGSATQPERDAADWLNTELTALGFAPQQQPFVSATSTVWPVIYAAGAVLLSLFFFWQPQPVGAGAALVLTGVTLISFILHLRLRENPLRWITPNDDSRNVVVTVPALAATQPPLLITANLDSPRAARNASRPLLLLTLAGMALLVVLFAIGIPNNSQALRQIALVPGVIALVLLLQRVMALRAKATAGANGNASGVSIALDLARRLQQQPLAGRNVILAFTGCGEIEGAGLKALLKNRAAELKGAAHIAISHAGGNLPLAIIRREQYTAAIEGDARLAALGEQVAQACGESIQVRDFNLANGELSIGAKHELRAIGLMRLDSAGLPMNWRTTGDTVNTVEEASLQQAADFAWQWIQAIDSEA